MKDKQICKLIEHITAIMDMYEGRERKPYIKMELYLSGDMEVRIADKGIDAKMPYDGAYNMNIKYDCERTYNNCINHLVDLESMADSEGGAL